MFGGKLLTNTCANPYAQSPYVVEPYIASTLTPNGSLHFNKAEETFSNIN